MALDYRTLVRNAIRPPGFGPAPSTVVPDNRFAEAALARHKREGLELAVRARIMAMAATAVLLLLVAPWPELLYYQALVVLFVLIGLAQRRLGRVGQNRAELLLMFADLALMTAICLVPNPFAETAVPLATQYHFGAFTFFFVLLAGATLAYSWQTVMAVGTWTASLWGTGLLAMMYFNDDPQGIGPEVRAVYADNPVLLEFLDPTSVVPDLRLQEAVVFLIVAAILAIAGRRQTRLLLEQAEAERARANLSRYFSPNVVEELAHNDEPLRQVRMQEIAVLFVDIVGFTAYAAGRPPEKVIDTLRAFHARMEAEVFAHHGTLDKYLGDGLMATFGTPFAGIDDAARALACTHAMARAVDAWNAGRVEAGHTPMRASFGLHYGPVVLGDIGANRLEFAVIGNTVNIASRIEALSRPLGATIVASDALIAAARAQGATIDDDSFTRREGQAVRGIPEAMTLWTAG